MTSQLLFVAGADLYVDVFLHIIAIKVLYWITPVYQKCFSLVSLNDCPNKEGAQLPRIKPLF